MLFTARCVRPIDRDCGRLRVWASLAILLALGLGQSAIVLAQSVSDGQGLYTSKGCSGCHITPPTLTGNNNRNGANNRQAIRDAITNNTGGMGGLVLSTVEEMSLALFIGQKQVPEFAVANPVATIRVRSGASALVTKDIYPLLRKGLVGVIYYGAAGDGTGGTSFGLSATSPANAIQSSATTSVAMSGATSAMVYNLRYQPSAASQYAGADGFSVTVQNSVGSDVGTVDVQVYGITSGASTIQALKGQGYVNGTLYTATCNSCVAGSFSATGLPTGLAIDASSGQINGTPGNSAAVGNYAVTVRANSSGAVDSGDGQVSKSFMLQLGGINSGTPGPFGQGMVITPYNITTTLGGVGANAPYSLTPLPAGLAFDNGSGQLSGIPTGSGPFAVTMTATTGLGVTSQDVTITVNPASVPNAISSNLPASSVMVAGTVGTLINGSNYAISATSATSVTYSSTELAALGLTVNPASGAITGTPNASGDFVVNLRASNIGGAGTPLNRTIRINPNTAPVVSSTNPPDGNVGTPFPAFSVTATQPLNVFALDTGSVLPDGLLLNSSNGAITGSPSTSGLFTVRFTAQNAFAVSAPVALTFNIISDVKPTITSPVFASFLAGVAITPIQVVATNPAITAYQQTGLPPGLQLHTTTGIISGTPTTPGVFTAMLSADNQAPGPAFGTPRAVVFTVGVPAPTACAMEVPLNTATTLDLASCLFGGFAPTGVSIVATPAHGTAVANGTRVTYTPVNNFFGADTFTFVGSGAGGMSPQGTVTVTVTGRPNPTQDPVVTGLLTAQSETAQRFSRTQIANFQRRMESLHNGARDTGSPAAGLQAPGGAVAFPIFGGSGLAGAAPIPSLAGSSLGGSGPAGGRTFDGGPQTPGGITALAANHAPMVAQQSEVLDALASGMGIKSMPLAEGVLSLVKNRSVNLAGVAPGLGLAGNSGRATDATSYWVEGIATFGTRDASGGFSGSEFSSSGITVGADKRYSDTLALGLGLGYARDKTLVGTDGSVNRAKGYSIAVFGSYQPSKNTFVDALLGFGSLAFDTTRFVAPANDFALGKRSGTQIFGSLAGGYEFRNGNLLLSPYGRVDFSTDRLDNSTETGAGAYALTYFAQTNTSVQGALGMRAESIHATEFGYAVPRLRVEYRHEFWRSGQATIGYADQVGGPRYTLASAGGPRDSMLLGLGSDFILRDGLTLSVEYQLSHSFSNASTHALRLRLSKDFDVRGLPRLLSQDPKLVHDEPINVQLEAGAVYDDNVTRAKAGPDTRGDHSYALNVSKTIVQPLSEQSRVLMIGTLGGEKARRFNGLSRLSASAEAEYQYRASSEFDEPTFGAFGRVSAEAFESSLRDGYRISVGVSYRQPLTDRINVFAALSHNLRNASSKVFSTRDNAIRGNIDYALSDKEILYLGGEYRRGDIVSTGRASLENVTIAEVFAQDDAYAGGQLFSYRFRGNTVLLTMGYNLGLGPRDSIDFSWRHIRSTPGLRPGWVTSPRSYIANQLSAVYLMRF